MLDDLALNDALPLINRYLETPLVVADNGTGAIRIGGIYNIKELNTLVTIPAQGAAGLPDPQQGRQPGPQLHSAATPEKLKAATLAGCGLHCFAQIHIQPTVQPPSRLCVLLADGLRLIVRIGRDLLLGERQHTQLLLRKRQRLVPGVFRGRVTRQRERQQALGLRALFIERHHLQIAGAADHFAFAVGSGHALNGVVDAQRARPAVDRRLLATAADHLDVAPASYLA